MTAAVISLDIRSHWERVWGCVQTFDLDAKPNRIWIYSESISVILRKGRQIYLHDLLRVWCRNRKKTMRCEKYSGKSLTQFFTRWTAIFYCRTPRGAGLCICGNTPAHRRTMPSPPLPAYTVVSRCRIPSMLWKTQITSFQHRVQTCVWELSWDKWLEFFFFFFKWPHFTVANWALKYVGKYAHQNNIKIQ